MRYNITSKSRIEQFFIVRTMALIHSKREMAEKGEILAPIKLKCLPRTKSQGDESAAPRRLLLSLPIRSPISGKSRNPTVGPREPEGHKIGMQLLQRPALLARLAGLGLKPASELLGKRIKLVRAIRNGELRLDRARIQMLLDSITRQPGSSCDLSDRQPQAQRHTPDHVQKFHVDHSIAPPAANCLGERVTWVNSQWKLRAQVGHFWVQINNRCSSQQRSTQSKRLSAKCCY